MRKEWEEYQAIYVHIPFCVQKCLYCDFASYANCNRQVKERYVAALCREIAYPLSLPVAEHATIYFGGGTPSTLTVEEIAKIVAALKAKGLWRNPKEATIEVNPGTVDVDKLKAFKGLGPKTFEKMMSDQALWNKKMTPEKQRVRGLRNYQKNQKKYNISVDKLKQINN